MSEASIRHPTIAQSFERGQGYYRAGSVYSLIQRGDRLLARVAGSEATHTHKHKLIEKALYGILRPAESSHWGYQIARDYAERYGARYMQSLIPESAPMAEDIANFWSQYHFGEPLNEWLSRQKSHSKASRKKS
ncbi:hypothetical protein [Pantanalinema rosaneae]|uniref:hypothetical protein n=1 Tax=Pantanalinema rosaneae TaxID=1620701 RepID=UPI003D6E952E